MGLAGSGQTLNNGKDGFIANCLRTDGIPLGSKDRVIVPRLFTECGESTPAASEFDTEGQTRVLLVGRPGSGCTPPACVSHRLPGILRFPRLPPLPAGGLGRHPGPGQNSPLTPRAPLTVPLRGTGAVRLLLGRLPSPPAAGKPCGGKYCASGSSYPFRWLLHRHSTWHEADASSACSSDRGVDTAPCWSSAAWFSVQEQSLGGSRPDFTCPRYPVCGHTEWHFVGRGGLDLHAGEPVLLPFQGGQAGRV